MPPTDGPGTDDAGHGRCRGARRLCARPFEALVWKAVESLPQTFLERLGSVAIVIQDEPTAEELSSVHAWGLLGLYTGVPRTAYGVDTFAVTSKIVIFRGPHLRLFHDASPWNEASPTRSATRWLTTSASPTPVSKELARERDGRPR